jgi:hypothetical protein
MKTAKVGALQGRVGPAAMVPHPHRGIEEDGLRCPQDLHRQVRIGAELAVALIDLANRADDVHAHHEGRAARIHDRFRLAARRLGREPLASGRQRAELRRHPRFMALVSPKFLGSRMNCV